MNEQKRSVARIAVDAQTLVDLYAAPEILRVVNVWDAVSAKVVADLPGTRAIATAGHGIAASYGYPDGERISLDLMIEALSRIVAITDLPVSADLDGGFGDAGAAVRRAIEVGVSGANIEDQLRPVDESVDLVRAAVEAGAAARVPFALNARTDAYVLGGDRSPEAHLADAIQRGQAYLEAGATCVFVPGPLSAEATRTLVSELGERKVSVIGLPNGLSAAEYEALGVARISYGPQPQNVALNALKSLGESLYADGGVPGGLAALNNL